MFSFLKKTDDADAEDAKPPIALILEDEATLRLNAVAMLEDMGFSVLNAGSAEEALALMENGDVELLIADIHMPGDLDGLGVARQAAERWPEMRTVICSGQTRVVGSQLPARAVFVGKPYTVDDLENAILSF